MINAQEPLGSSELFLLGNEQSSQASVWQLTEDKGGLCTPTSAISVGLGYVEACAVEGECGRAWPGGAATPIQE